MVLGFLSVHGPFFDDVAQRSPSIRGGPAYEYEHGHTDQDIPTYIRNGYLGLVPIFPFQIWALGFLVAVL